MAKDQPIWLYNTLTRQKEEFTPRDENKVGIYVCGVTPYDDAHLGHARPSIFFDVVRKYLRRQGYDVTLVQNFTDVDDKIIARAAEKGVEPLDLSEHYSQAYLESMDRLGIERADHYPKVSTHIEDIVDMIKGLIEQGAAYESEGNVYFKVSSFPDYGKLSKQRKEELIAGSRIEAGEGKEDPLDFALWKAAKEGEPWWESPWGPGRPGWHIECSAMSLKYLGNPIDIHGGGLDLVFPHHENEVAQSEAYTGEEPFVRYWMHLGLVNFGDEKMSKSLGNFVTVDEALNQYPPELLRYVVLQHHYRSPIDFGEDHMETMRRGWQRLNRFFHELTQVTESYTVEQAKKRQADEALVDAVERTVAKFDESMADDFNTPAALASLFELIREARPVLSQVKEVEQPDAALIAGLGAVHGVFTSLAGDLLGILAENQDDVQSGGNSELVGQLVQLLVDLRAEARAQRNFEQADQIRDRLTELGIALEDSPEGTRWTFIQ